jgi:hypothetical protein
MGGLRRPLAGQAGVGGSGRNFANRAGPFRPSAHRVVSPDCLPQRTDRHCEEVLAEADDVLAVVKHHAGEKRVPVAVPASAK